MPEGTKLPTKEDVDALRRVASGEARPTYTDLARALTMALGYVDARTAQLPDGMKECAIILRRCSLGHAWLMAANWVGHGCPMCARRAVEAERDAARKEAEEYQGDLVRVAEFAAHGGTGEPSTDAGSRALNAVERLRERGAALEAEAVVLRDTDEEVLKAYRQNAPPAPAGLLDAVAKVLESHERVLGARPAEVEQARHLRSEAMASLAAAYDAAKGGGSGR